MTLSFYCHRVRSFAAAVLILSIAAVPAFGQAVAPVPALSAPELEFAEKITIASIKEIVTALSAPDMEGRGTGQPGGDKAAAWIADRFKSIGLKPLGDKGSYLQTVDFKETVATPETAFTFGDQSLTYGTEFAFIPQNNGNKNVSGNMVFVSYGIQAKQANIDMLEGVALKGKVVVMLQGPPPGFPQKSWDEQKAQMSIYRSIVLGGASALVFIGQGEEKRSPEEWINYMSRRQLTRPDEEGYPPEVPPMVYVSASGADKLFSNAGITRKDALAKAVSRDFKPIDLKERAKIVGKFAVNKVSGNNVVGLLEGSDPKLKEEAVVFTAHYDAYGKENGKIYHGAADNALGTAEMLAVADAYSKASVKPKRSMIFLAVTGEEYGLHGSKHWAKTPTWDIKKVAANLNLDGVGSEVYGAVKTVVGYGAEHSSLGTVLAGVGPALDIKVIPDPMPDERIFYRSDHYSFVERGVPALKLLGAPAGEKEVWMKRIKDWQKGDYHQPGDIILPTWVWEGPERLAEIVAILGWRISQAADMPAWLPTSRFAKLERGNTKELPEEQ